MAVWRARYSTAFTPRSENRGALAYDRLAGPARWGRSRGEGCGCTPEGPAGLLRVTGQVASSSVSTTTGPGCPGRDGREVAGSGGFDDTQVYRRLQGLLVQRGGPGGVPGRGGAGRGERAGGVDGVRDHVPLRRQHADRRLERRAGGAAGRDPVPRPRRAVPGGDRRPGRSWRCPTPAPSSAGRAYTPVAVEAGVRCSVSLPLTLAEDTFGAMNVYGFTRPTSSGLVSGTGWRSSPRRPRGRCGSRPVRSTTGPCWGRWSRRWRRGR